MATVYLKRDIEGCILDLGGGGEGVIGRLYRESVTAIDIRQDELDEAPPGPAKLLMDARALDFGEASFDHVTAFYFFMYLPKEDHLQAMREAFHVLRPGGQLHIWDAVIEGESLFMVELDIDLAGDMLHTGYGVQKPDPAQDEAHFLALAKAAGFLPKSTAQREGQLCLRLEKPHGGRMEAERP